MAAAATPPRVVLMVDDEPNACKWFARLYGNEFDIWTANGVDEALKRLDSEGAEVAVLLTDYLMPVRNGVDLLAQVRQRFPHLARLLVSAHADRDVALAAVNQGQVEKILTKPLDETLTRQALREALGSSQQRWLERVRSEQRSAQLRETLGFIAHEVASPLATVQGYLDAMQQRHRAAGGTDPGVAQISESQPGEVLSMIEAARRRTDYAQSLVSSFVRSARDAYRPGPMPGVLASELLHALRREYPFESGQSHWLKLDVVQDFDVPRGRDLVYLALCTLVKNALLALQAAPPAEPVVRLTLAPVAAGPGLPALPCLQVQDNGPGIAPALLQRLTHEPVSTRPEGSGMGLMFCRRVMTSLGGFIGIHSAPGQGACVRLIFPEAAATSPGDRT